MAQDALTVESVRDLHVHLEGGLTIPEAVKQSQLLGVKFGLVEETGCRFQTKTEQELLAYTRNLAGQPVYRGLQVYGTDWKQCVSKEAAARFDYILSDGLVLPGPDGKEVLIWEPGVKIADPEEFMERYVAFNVRVVSGGSIDIWANATFLPIVLQPRYDELWTESRMEKVIDAAVSHGVAIEINSTFRIPSNRFIKLAKSRGAKFSFGSNSHGSGFGNAPYFLKVARECGLTKADLFVPGKEPGTLRSSDASAKEPGTLRASTKRGALPRP
jgi:hypothetical protein